MITAEHENPRAGAGPNFSDTVAIDFCDPEHELFGLAWFTRLPNAGRSRASVVLFSEGELVENLEREANAAVHDWSEARLDGIAIQTRQPLERWTLDAEGGQGALRLEAEALSLPRALPAAVPSAIGVDQYEQLCRLSGTVDLAGRTYPVRCLGRRQHWWGEFPWNRIGRWRGLYAVSSGGRAISVVAVLPAGSEGHDAELRAAQLLDDPDALPFEDVRLSTVYGRDGMPAKVGLELWTGEDEFPRRFGGEAICGMRGERGGHELIVSFFRWSIEGDPAYGCYQLLRPM